MHNRFVDKKRRFLNFRDAQVESILPEHFASLYPKFISLLENYYDFQDQNNSTELLNHLFAARDINETDITLLTYIEDELLLGEAYFKGFGNNDTELRAAANFSNILFRSKGTRFAIEWFFRSFYGEDVEVLYPKENVFKIGQSESQIGPDSLRYLTDDKLYQTFALLIRVGIPISKWREVFKLFIHPAGMYLGGEVFVQDEVAAPIVTANDFLGTNLQDEVYTSPSYVLTSSSPQDEGAAFPMNIVGTGGRPSLNGTDAVYWYGEHITTSDSDFGVNFFDGRTGLPDSNDKQYIDVDAGVGSFNILTINDEFDSASPEGNETFRVYLQDRNGRALDDLVLTLNDIQETYSFSLPAQPTPATCQEGTGAYNITLAGTNVPGGGNTTIRYFISPPQSSAGIVDSDFDEYYAANSLTTTPRGYPDSADVAVPVSIVNGAGTITLTPRVDGISDGLEAVQLVLVNSLDAVVGTGGFFILNQTPILSVAAGDQSEGNNVEFTITSGSYNIGKNISWELLDAGLAAATDPRFSETSGTVQMTSTDTVVSIPTTVTNTPEGPLTFNIRVTDTNITTGLVQATDSFIFSDAAGVYSIRTSPALTFDGDAVDYIVETQNVPDGTQVYLYFSGSNPPNDADPATDWTPAAPTSGARQLLTIASGTATFSTNLTADGDPVNEFYEAYLYDNATGGTELTQFDGRILTGSLAATLEANEYAETSDPGNLQALISDTVNEGWDLHHKFVTNLGAGNYYYWLEGTATSDDVTPFPTSASRSTLVVPNNNPGDNLDSAEFVLQTIADELYDPNEDFTVFVSDTTSGPAIAQLAITGVPVLTHFTINSSSNQEYEIRNTHPIFTDYELGSPGYPATYLPDYKEGENFALWVGRIQGTEAEQIYVELSGAAASLYTTTQQDAEVSAGNWLTNATGGRFFTFTPVADDGIIQGDRTLTVTVRRVSHSGPILETFDVTVTDLDTDETIDTFTFAPDPVTEPTDPATTDVVATLTGTNLAGKTIYIRPDWLAAQALTSTAGSTTVSLPLENTTGISIGDKVWTGSAFLPGTVSFVGGSSVTMSQQIGTSLSSSTVLYFARQIEFESYDMATNPPYGSVTFASNTDTITVRLQENTFSATDVADTFRAYNFASGESTLANSLNTETLNITNVTVGDTITTIIDNASIPTDTQGRYEFSNSDAVAAGDDAYAQLFVKFDNDGKIYAADINVGTPGNTNTSTPTTWEEVGEWVPQPPSGVFDPADYTVTNVQTVQFGILNTTGSYGTALNLGTDRIWKAFLFVSQNGVANSSSNEWEFTVTEIANPANTDTITTKVTVACAVASSGGESSDGEFACFLAGTQITMSDGTTKNIEDIVVGDQVLGKDGVTNEVISVDVSEATNREIFNVNNGLLEMTGGHLVLTTDGWAAGNARTAIALHPELEDEIIQLEEYQELVLADGTTEPIVSLTSEYQRVPVYNINVTDGDDTFVASGVTTAPGVVVHNK